MFHFPISTSLWRNWLKPPTSRIHWPSRLSAPQKQKWPDFCSQQAQSLLIIAVHLALQVTQCTLHQLQRAQSCMTSTVVRQTLSYQIPDRVIVYSHIFINWYIFQVIIRQYYNILLHPVPILEKLAAFRNMGRFNNLVGYVTYTSLRQIHILFYKKLYQHCCIEL